MTVVRPPGPLPVRPGPGTGNGNGSGSGRWRLALVSEGPLTLCRADPEDGGPEDTGTRLEPGELVLWEPSRPGRTKAVATTAGAGAAAGTTAPSRAIVLHLPREAMPVPDRVLERLAARPVPSDSGPGALLARFVEGLADQAAGAIPAPQCGRLGSAALSLSAAFLAHLAQLAEPPDTVAPFGPRPDRTTPAGTSPTRTTPARTAELLDAVKEYIDRHLGAPWLSPAAIASAHHISVRYLHHLFRHDARTVGGHVRAQRLDRCRADLADPALAHRNVSRISARWGFPDPAVFGRAFKKAYGVAPGEYRRRLLGA